MNEQPRAPAGDSFEERTRALFHDSVEGLDFATRSRLTQARHGAREAPRARRPAWIYRRGFWTPAGVTGAAVLGAFLWLGSPSTRHAATVADGLSNFDDLEIVASTDEGSAAAIDMLQDDIEFYDWAERTANPGPSAQG
ncbi:MAG: hypothetical protein NVS9B2_19610 [Steroidobacteraceae bacterium]